MSKLTKHPENNLAAVFPDTAKEWHPTKNGDLTPDKVTPRSAKEVWWKCERGHEWKVAIAFRNPIRKGVLHHTGCPYCTTKNTKILPGYNDLKTRYPEVAEEWHPTKNEELTPETAGPHSNKHAWWICKTCGHEWDAVISNRVAGSRCPVCSKKIRAKRKKENE